MVLDAYYCYEVAGIPVAVKEKEGELACTQKMAGNGSAFSSPLRNLAGQSCLSYFMCGHTMEKVNVKITSANKQKAYVDIVCQCTDQIAHLAMGSALTQKKGLLLEITTEGSHKVQMAWECSVAQGKSLSLVYYYVKSYDMIAESLLFSLDILGWTAI